MSKDLGEIIETRGELEIHWQIPNFFSLPENADSWYSPNFCFNGENWYLQIYPNGETGSVGWIGLYLQKMEEDRPADVAFTFGLMSVDGKMENELSLRHTFEGPGWGYSKFFLRSDLINRKSELVPSDVLTITCSIRKCSPKAFARTGKLLRDLKALMFSVDNSDLTVKVKEEDFPLHKNIFQYRTPAFLLSLTEDRAPGTVPIDNCEIDTFRKFVEYIYTGSVQDLSVKTTFGLYRLADRYGVKELKECCSECLEKLLTIHTFCEILTFARMYDEKDLLEVVTNFFADKVKEIIETDEWEKFLSENPVYSNEMVMKAFDHYERE